MGNEFRKPNRLPSYDYSSSGSYSITICTKDRKNWFWTSDQDGKLSETGQIVEQAICQIPEHYSYVTVDQYAVMPNHVHILFTMNKAYENSVPRIIGQMKRWVSMRMGGSVWQKSYHDRVIRDAHEFMVRWNYIADNPRRWTDDELYQSE